MCKGFEVGRDWMCSRTENRAMGIEISQRGGMRYRKSQKIKAGPDNLGPSRHMKGLHSKTMEKPLEDFKPGRVRLDFHLET